MPLSSGGEALGAATVPGTAPSTEWSGPRCHLGQRRQRCALQGKAQTRPLEWDTGADIGGRKDICGQRGQVQEARRGTHSRSVRVDHQVASVRWPPGAPSRTGTCPPLPLEGPAGCCVRTALGSKGGGRARWGAAGII